MQTEKIGDYVRQLREQAKMPLRKLATIFVLGTMMMAMGCNGCNSIEGGDRVSFDNCTLEEIGMLIDGADGSGEFIDKPILFTPTSTTSSIHIFQSEFANNSLHNEVCAFQKGRPPFIRDVGQWNPGIYTLVGIPFESEIPIDFTVWVITGSFVQRANEALAALSYVESIWIEERLGLLIGDITFIDKTGIGPELVDEFEDNDPDHINIPTYFERIRAEVGDSSNRINIYCIKTAVVTRWDGAWMGSTEGLGSNYMVIGDQVTGDGGLFLHEIAHSFSLDHVDELANFNSANAAWEAPNIFQRRQYFTEGQIFRCHFNSNSFIRSKLADALNLENLPPSPAGQWSCGHTGNSVFCPRLDKRIWADGELLPDPL